MKKCLLISGFILLLISCRLPDKKVIVAEFSVNKSLLSDNAFISKTGFSIFPPKNWSKIESYDSTLQKRVFNRLDNKLLAIYKSDTSNCAFIISELPETNFHEIKRPFEKQNSFSSQDSVWTSVQSSSFKYKDYEMIQVVSQNSEIIIFKLFVHRLSELFELDYVIPRNEININMQSVESSIGSLK